MLIKFNLLKQKGQPDSFSYFKRSSCLICCGCFLRTPRVEVGTSEPHSRRLAWRNHARTPWQCARQRRRGQQSSYERRGRE